MNRLELIEAYEISDMGDVEFFELALDAGMELEEIERAMKNKRELEEL